MTGLISTLPDDRERQLATENSRRLARFLDREDGVSIEIEDHDRETIVLPRQAVRLLVDIMTYMAQGAAVNVVPVHREVTTQEAADILNVSRPFLIKLLEQGELPYRKVGTHRRILFGDLMEYKNRRDTKMDRAADELTVLSQKLGLDQ